MLWGGGASAFSLLMKKDRRLGARGHALWATGASACCSVEVLVTVRDGRVIGDMSGAGAGAALGCCWGCCFEVLVTVRAHINMGGRVLGRVLFVRYRGCGIIMMLSAAS